MAASAVSPFVHEVLYYNDLVEFVAGTVPFVQAGVAAGEPCLVAVPPPRLQLIRAELGDLAARVTFVDMAAAGRNPGRILPDLRTFTDQHAPNRVRIVGEPIFVGRTTVAIPTCVRHESLLNAAFAEANVAILCPLDVTSFGHLIPYEERTHPTVITPDGRRRSLGYIDPRTMVAILNQPLPEPRHPFATAKAGAAEAVTRLIAAAATKAGLAEAATADLQQAATALLGPDTSARVWVEPDRLVCELREPGEPPDLLAGRLIPDPGSRPGWALATANRLCDLVQTHVTASMTVTRLHRQLSA